MGALPNGSVRRVAVLALLAAAATLAPAVPASAGSGWVSGTVYEQQTYFGTPFAGDPIAGAAISVNGSAATATTDASGRYNLSLPNGTYTVKVKAQGYNGKVLDDVKVGDNATTAVDFLLAMQTGNLVGKVTDQAGNPAKMTQLAYGPGPVPEVSTFTGDDGTYILRDLPVGTLNVTVTPFGARPFNISVTIHNAQTTTMFITVKTPVHVSVLGPDGRPVMGAVVMVGDVADVTDMNGSVVLETAPGSYRLTVRAERFKSYSDTLVVESGGSVVRVTLPFKEGETTDAAFLGGLALLVLLGAVIAVIVIAVVAVLVIRRTRERRRLAAAVLPAPLAPGAVPQRDSPDAPQPRPPPGPPNQPPPPSG